MSPQPLQAALAAYQAGRFGESAALCRDALALSADDESVLALLGMAEHAAGHHDRAAIAFRDLTMRRPGVAEYWSNLGYMLRLQKSYVEAEGAFAQALALAPRSCDALVNYGLLLLDMGRLAEARHRFLDAFEADPSSSAARIYAALTCFECGDARRAEALIPPPAAWGGLDRDLRHDLSMALIQVGRIAEAERVLQHDVARGDPTATARMAMLHERTNRVESASGLLARIRGEVAEDDKDAMSDLLSVDAALALREKNYGRARESTEALLATGLSAQAQASAHFVLARISDQQGQPDEAMAQLAKAHEIHFRLASEIVPDIAASRDEPLRIASKWMQPAECDFVTHDVGPDADASPVFIVGFPRSGTTMLEQMLDAHPRYASMDERTILQRCVEQMEAWGLDYPHELGRISPTRLDALRALYWAESAKVLALSPGQTLVDKNPLNMLRLPMIRRLFPSARIILALRHPCDVVLSCYMQQFRSPAFMVLCSTLERLAKSYVNAMKFWIHHQPLLAPDALLLRYEDTVTGFPEQVERIAAYLGIEDRSPLERFSAHAARKGYISTPSYSQVVEPVNTRAMGRWRAYRDYFAPVLPILQPIADHWNYSIGAG